MATCIDTFGSITIEQIKNDENLVLKTNEKNNDIYFHLKSNEKAFLIPYGFDNFNYFKVRTDEAILLLKYLFEKYDMYFVDEDITEECLFHKPPYTAAAFYWIETIDYMLNMCDWPEESKIKLEKQKNEWSEYYNFFNKYIKINELLEVENLLINIENKNDIDPNIITKINQFENNTLKSLIENKYDIPENFLNNIITKINKLNDNIKNGNIKIIREIDNEPITIINPNNDELPF